MKKNLILCFACMMTVSMSVPAFAANFHDINDVPWEGAKTYINSAADQGLMVGSTDSSGNLVFRAKENVTLCETMQLAYSLAKKQGASAVSQDVITKWSSVMTSNRIVTWAQEAVAYGLENSIITTNDLATFMDANGNSNQATREVACTIFGKTLAKKSSADSSAKLSFADASTITAASVPYIDLLVDLKIIAGDDNNKFNPTKNINRAEMAVIITKAVNATPPTTNTADTKGSVTGAVLAVEDFGATTMVTVLDGANKRGFIGDDTVPVTNNGQSVKYSSIGVGDTVTVEYDGSIVKSVTITVDAQPDSAVPSDAKTHTVSGTIDDLQETRLKLQYDDNTDDIRSYGIKDADALKVQLNGSSSSFNDLLKAMSSYKEISAELTVYDENGAEYITEISATTDVSSDGKAKGTLTSIDDDSVRIKLSSGTVKTYDMDEDDVKIYLNDESVDVDDLDKAIDKGTVTATITVKNKTVTRIEAESNSKEDGDADGKINSISEDKLKVGSKSYDVDDYRDVTVDVDDGRDDSITTYKNLITAVEDDKKVIEVTITIKDDEVTKIKGEVVEASGKLDSINGDDITIEFDSGSTEYRCDDDVSVKLDGDSIDLDELDDELDNEDIEVTVTIEDGYVTYIKAEID